jgi:hypothetical protein
MGGLLRGNAGGANRKNIWWWARLGKCVQVVKGAEQLSALPRPRSERSIAMINDTTQLTIKNINKKNKIKKNGKLSVNIILT